MLKTHDSCEAQKARVDMSYQQALQMRQIWEDLGGCCLHTGDVPERCEQRSRNHSAQTPPFCWLLALRDRVAAQQGELVQFTSWPCGCTAEVTSASKAVCLALSSSPGIHTDGLRLAKQTNVSIFSGVLCVNQPVFSCRQDYCFGWRVLEGR